MQSSNTVSAGKLKIWGLFIYGWNSVNMKNWQKSIQTQRKKIQLINSGH